MWGYLEVALFWILVILALGAVSITLAGVFLILFVRKVIAAFDVLDSSTWNGDA